MPDAGPGRDKNEDKDANACQRLSDTPQRQTRAAAREQDPPNRWDDDAPWNAYIVYSTCCLENNHRPPRLALHPSSRSPLLDDVGDGPRAPRPSSATDPPLTEVVPWVVDGRGEGCCCCCCPSSPSGRAELATVLNCAAGRLLPVRGSARPFGSVVGCGG